MMIEQISETEFRNRHTHRGGTPFSTEVEWWSTRDRKRLGIVLRDKVDGDYSFVMLRDSGEGMNAHGLGHSFATVDDARRKLFDALGAD